MKNSDKNKKLVLQNSNMPSIANFQQYLNFVNSQPMLSEEEELDLARKLKYQDDLTAAQKLVLSHLRFVVKIARGMSGYGLPVHDLVQEGTVGLMKAVKKYDPEIGVRLVSYAVHWIKAEMNDYILKNWKIVKVVTTKPQRKLFFNLRKNKKHLGTFSKDEIRKLAIDLNVSEKDVYEMEQRMSGYDLSFDMDGTDDDRKSSMPVDYLSDENLTPENQINAIDLANKLGKDLQKAIEMLDDKSKTIIQERWLAEKKTTLSELAERYDLSAERIRQLEKIAMDKMKKILE